MRLVKPRETKRYLLDGKLPSAQRSACLMAVCCFVLLMSRAPQSGAAHTPVAGLVVVALWVPLAAVYKIQFGRHKPAPALFLGDA